MAIADARIVRTADNVLTEHGPKLLPITVVCKQPGASGFFDKEVYRSDIGFAYSGSTLSALAAHALSNTLLSKLVGMPHPHEQFGIDRRPSGRAIERRHVAPDVRQVDE